MDTEEIRDRIQVKDRTARWVIVLDMVEVGTINEMTGEDNGMEGIRGIIRGVPLREICNEESERVNERDEGEGVVIFCSHFRTLTI